MTTIQLATMKLISDVKPGEGVDAYTARMLAMPEAEREKARKLTLIRDRARLACYAAIEGRAEDSRAFEIQAQNEHNALWQVADVREAIAA